MKPNTALAFLFTGISLALLSAPAASQRRRRAGQWLALPAALIAGLALCEYALGWSPGIDELLFQDDVNAAGTSAPGRMAPSSAINFLLLAFALLCIQWQPRRGFRPAEILAIAAAAVSAISLTEYALGEPILYGFDSYTRMALHTAVGFLVLSTGVLLARPDQGLVGLLSSGRVHHAEGKDYAVMSLVLMVVLVSGLWYYHAQEQQVRTQIEGELEAIARLKVDRIVQWRNERLADAAMLMTTPFFAAVVRDWMIQPRVESTEEILRTFQALQRNKEYSDVRLLDTQGKVRLSVSGSTGTPHPEERQALALALLKQQPEMSDLHSGPPDGTPHLNFVAPLLPGTGPSQKSVGAIVLQFDARRFLYPFLQSWPTPSFSAEAMLVRKDGNTALYLNDTRLLNDTALTLRVPLARQDAPAVRAVLGEEGVFTGIDYRGVKVLSVLRRIPDTPWFIVTKMDEEEALAYWHVQGRLILAIIAALSLALVAAMLLVWQQRSKFRALEQASRAFHVLSECNKALVRADNETQLLNEICRIVVELGGYKLAWVGFAEDDEVKHIYPVGQAGYEAGHLQSLNLTWADTGCGLGPTGTAIRTGANFLARHIPTNPDCISFREHADRYGYSASLGLPLKIDQQIRGALTIHARDPDAFQEREVNLLTELANDLTFGIKALRDQAELDLHRHHMEELLKERNEGYGAILRTTMDGFCITDTQGRFLEVNDAYTALMGYSHEELLKMSIMDVEANESPSQTADRIRTIMRTGSDRFLSRLRRQNGSILDADISVNYLPMRGGRFFIFVRDDTQRQRTEKELRRLKEELEQRVVERTAELNAANSRLRLSEFSLERASVAVYWIDQDARILRVNDTACQLSGYSDDELLSMTILDLSPGLTTDGWKDYWHRLRQGKPLTFEAMHQCEDGRVVPVEIETGFLDFEGKEYGFAFVRDITERKNSETLIRESEAKFRLLFERNLDGILLLEGDRFIECNPAGLDMLGCSADQMKDITPWECSPPLQPDGRASEEKANEMIATALSEGRHRFEWMHRRMNGEDFPVEVTLIPIYWGGREVLYTSWHDISDRKKAETALVRRDAVLETINWIAQRFLATTEPWRKVIDEILPRIGTAAEVHRVSLFENMSDPGFPLQSRQIAEWVLPGARASRETSSVHGFRWSDYGGQQFAESLMRGQPIFACRRELPASFIDLLADGDIESIAVIPVFVEQRLWGCVAFDNCFVERQWNQSEQEALNLVAATLGAAIQRENARRMLQESEAKFRSLVEQSMVGITMLDGERLIYENPRADEIFGYDLGELVDVSMKTLVMDEDWPVVAHEMQRVLSGNTGVVRLEFRGRRKDGEEVLIGAQVLARRNGERPALMSVLQDITEKRQAEQQIRHYITQLESSLMHTVEVATALSEMRDPYTADHARRVAMIAVAIGAELGFDDHRQEGLKIAGFLHDIGKITIPSEILSKPGRINAAEFELIKGHPRAGYDVLKAVEFPWPVAQVALQHHERIDGSGYPQGLKGDDILLESRIMAVADVIEAMASHRPYRPGFGIEKALAEIERGRGTSYDENVVAACLRLFLEKGYELPNWHTGSAV